MKHWIWNGVSRGACWCPPLGNGECWGQVEGSREPKAPVQLQRARRGACSDRSRGTAGLVLHRTLREMKRSTHLISQAHGHEEADQSQPRPTTHCVPDLQFQFIEMQEFRVFSELFFRASLARSRSVNADYERHKILIQPKPTLFRAAPLCSDVERLFIPILVGYIIPKTCTVPKSTLLYWPETEKWSFSSCLFRDTAKQLQFDS